VQNSKNVGVGSVAGVVESVVITQRMIVLEFDVNRVQLGSLSSFALMSSLCFSWKVLAIFAMKGEFWRCHHGDSLLVSSWV
jgi:hypothetical protein